MKDRQSRRCSLRCAPATCLAYPFQTQEQLYSKPPRCRYPLRGASGNGSPPSPRVPDRRPGSLRYNCVLCPERLVRGVTENVTDPGPHIFRATAPRHPSRHALELRWLTKLGAGSPGNSDGRLVGSLRSIVEPHNLFDGFAQPHNCCADVFRSFLRPVLYSADSSRSVALTSPLVQPGANTRGALWRLLPRAARLGGLPFHGEGRQSETNSRAQKKDHENYIT